MLKRVYVPKSITEFVRVQKAFENAHVTPFLLGGGSNVIVNDGEIETPVVYTKNLNSIRIENGCVFCECGAKISEISRHAREFGLGGLEFLAGVPLTVGGALKMNASAFSRQIFDFAKSVFVFSRACDAQWQALIREVDARDIKAGYRKGVDGVVIGATLKLERVNKAESERRTKVYLAKRRAKQPRENSVGSVFKNGSIPSGKLIEDCGLKGLTIGGAKISEQHANFIVNTGGATASDFLALVTICEQEVNNRFEIQLEREFVWLK